MKGSNRGFALLAILVLLSGSRVCAQVGDNNPGGPAGIFNGQVTTGGSYDPYTGNLIRSVPDIIVAGGVGTYPLALSRIYNSRLGSGSSFGYSGWRHSYEWAIADSSPTTDSTALPSSYTVNFPDGRQEVFTTQTSWDPNYKRAALGTRERLKAIDSNSLVYLFLPDGGKVEFQATQVSYLDDCCTEPCPLCTFYYYTYVAQAIIDPYGQRTSFTRDAYGRLNKVTEPGTRYLQFFYTTSTGTFIDHVTASDGRTVQYYYVPFGTYTVLDHIVYYGNSAWTARYTYQSPNVGFSFSAPLLRTCDDPMYPGPMKKIGYIYRTAANPDGSAAVYGQISSENHYDGTYIGTAVSTLTVGAAGNSNIRTETRGGGQQRTFTYTVTGYVTWVSDFNGIGANQGYDANKYVNSVRDRRGNTTTFVRNSLTGVVTSSTSPVATDVYPSSAAGTVTYTYGSASCADTNNQDDTIPYYVCTATDEAGHVTSFLRDVYKRIKWILYPDGGYETFTYNSFGQVLTHRMTTGGTESFTYGGRGLKTVYRSPANATGNPTARYVYEAHDWLQDVTDALGTSTGDPNHSTSYTYNLRGQVLTMTHPPDPTSRYSITNVYNADGTLQNVTDELGHVTSYTYDDYKRVKTVMTPLRFTGDTTWRTTSFFYDAGGTANDYTDTNSQPTWITLPGTQRTKNTYDNNFRKLSTTVANATADAATTSYVYDNNGNLTTITKPNEQSGQLYYGNNTVIAYDERNRPKSVTDDRGKITSMLYDTAGRKYKVTRANGQTITYDSYDEMNRLLQQTATQDPNPSAVTRYTYTDAGLLNTMQDPKLNTYTYYYDTNGRKTQLTYPNNKLEKWHYDTAGRIDTFTNRNGKIQTFSYDALNRCTGFTWNDGLTTHVTLGYDAASRLLMADNDNATLDYTYFGDNLLQSETEHIINGAWFGGTVNYTYDANGNRASDMYPDGRDDRTYTYTNRNQLKTISEYGGWRVATYTYDVNGNIATRVPHGGANSTYSYDPLDRVTRIVHAFTDTTRTFDYDYDSVGNRLHVERDDSYRGDAFAYDLADQVTAAQLNVSNIWSVDPDPTIVYDANGNRTSFGAYGATDTYGAVNNLNQYTTRTVAGNTTTASYDNNANMTTALDTSTYTFDAQNRVTTASKNGLTVTFVYDALNRVVTRSFSDGRRYDNIWDGWNLILTYDGSNNWIVAPTHGPNGIEYEYNTTTLTAEMIFKDASGSTTHVADADTGQLNEWYRYDLDGTPMIYAPDGSSRTASAYDIRHYFTGQQWYSDLGLYDLRNRFYSPDIGRFLQTDPIGFEGDATNLYRYCGNNPVRGSDPKGTGGDITRAEGGDALDYGYHGGDGTGMVSFETQGFGGWDQLTLTQTEFYYSMATWSNIQMLGGFGGFLSTASVFGASALQPYGAPVHDGVPYKFANQYGSGEFITVGAQGGRPNLANGDTYGWDTSEQAAITTSYSALTFTTDEEWAGGTFKNQDGSYFSTIAFDPNNTCQHSWVGPEMINGSAIVDIWHTHVLSCPGTTSPGYFSSQDIATATRLHANIYMAWAGDWLVQVHGPDPTANPMSHKTYPGRVVAGPTFGW
jgi:RHS repeat-associated protein